MIASIILNSNFDAKIFGEMRVILSLNKQLLSFNGLLA